MAIKKRATTRKPTPKARVGKGKARTTKPAARGMKKRADISAEAKRSAALLLDLWTNAEFKANFLSNPGGALKNAGYDLPADIQIKVVEDTPDVFHIVIPNKPSNIKVEDIGKDLEAFKLSRSTNCFTGHTKKCR